MKPHFTLLFLITLLSSSVLAQTSLVSLKTEYKYNPLGIDKPSPRLSWVLKSDARNSMQQAYEIRAAAKLADLKKGRNLLWSTGKVQSDRSIHVPYAGKALRSFQRVYWQVRVWDSHGKRSSWSEAAWFETGFLPDTRWEASWIAAPWKEDLTKSQPSPYLRTDFRLAGPVKEARLYISSHGLYEAEINGKKVGNQLFTPGWTSYGTRLQYQSYDISSMVKPGPNAIGVVLGDGWFRGYLGWNDNRNVWGEELALIAQLRIVYTDGRIEHIGTGPGWKASKGAIRASDIYNGEFYDATRELDGWSLPGYDDSGLEEVEVLDLDRSSLLAPEGPAVRVVEEIEPVSIEKTKEGWLVDMGQNMVGWVKISAEGKAGHKMLVRHAEVLDKSGKMYYDNLRSAECTNTYVFKGGGEESFEPHFTFQGFRYVMVEAYPGTLTTDKIRGMVIHSDMEPIGSFCCSDSLINQLQHNIVWGLKGNFLDVPTDCPQRDERLGWTGDAQVFAATACFNMQAAGFYSKWLADLASDQGADGMIPQVIPNIGMGGGSTGWADAAVVIPWVLYLNYGDVSILERQYESMKAWIGYMEAHAGEDLIWQEDDWHWGDWLAYDASKSDYTGAYTTKDLIATAYFSYSSSLVAKVAEILGKSSDAAYYKALSERIKAAFNAEYVTPNGRLVSHTQTAYTLALAFDLLDEEKAEKAAAYLAGDVEKFGHITTGFLGTPLISYSLTENGRNDLAYMLLNRKEYPSWLYPVTRGATTIWERWDGLKPDSTFQNPGMNSFNHYAYGAIGKWLYEVVAGIGIDPGQPGYKHILIAPRPGGGLDFAKASHRSMYGEIESGWTVKDGKLRMEILIPANTKASVCVPAQSEGILLDAKPLGTAAEVNGSTLLELGSGRYVIEAPFE